MLPSQLNTPDINGWYASVMEARRKAISNLVSDYILRPESRLQNSVDFIYKPGILAVWPPLFTQEEGEHLQQHQLPWKPSLTQLARKDATAIHQILYTATDGVTPLDTAMAQYTDKQRTHKIWHGVFLGLTLLAGYGGLIGLEVYVGYIYIHPMVENSSIAIHQIPEQITQGIRDGTLSRFEEYQLKLLIREFGLKNGSHAVEFFFCSMAILFGMGIFWLLALPAGELRDKADDKARQDILRAIATTTLSKPELQLSACKSREALEQINLAEVSSFERAELGNAVTALKLALHKEIKVQTGEPNI